MSWADFAEAEEDKPPRKSKVRFQTVDSDDEEEEEEESSEGTSATSEGYGSAKSQSSESCGIGARRVTFSDLVVNVNQDKPKERRLTLTPISEDVEQISKHVSKVAPPSWREEREVLISCIKFSLGLINLWRFPFLAYTNEGGSFVLTYLIVTVLVGIPVYYLELILSQYSGLGPAKIWSFCTFFKGLGPCVFFVCLAVIVYYNVILAYALLYMFHGLRKRVPWESCSSWWGADENCHDGGWVLCRKLHSNDSAQLRRNCSNATESPSENFWRIYNLNLSSGIQHPGNIQWQLALCLLIIWVLTAGMLIRRIYFKTIPYSYEISCTIVIFSYCVLFVFFIYGFFFDGATEGLKNLFVPKMRHLKKLKVWTLAATQNLFSLGVGMGGLFDIGNRNHFHHRLHSDAVTASLISSLTGVLSAVIVFCSLGHIAHKLGIPFFDLTNSGQCLALIAYSEATTLTWRPRVASLCFFSMLILISLDTSADVTSVIISYVNFNFSNLKHYAVLMTLAVCTCLYLIGLAFTTQGGIYLLNVFDTYCGIAILGTTLFEVIAFAWVYGVKKRVCDDLGRMTGMQPSIYMQTCWIILAPITLTILFGGCFFDGLLTDLFGEPYPLWAYALGWTLVGIALIQIPIWMVITLIQNRADIEKAFEPTEKWCSVIDPPKSKEIVSPSAMKDLEKSKKPARRKSIIKKSTVQFLI